MAAKATPDTKSRPTKEAAILRSEEWNRIVGSAVANSSLFTLNSSLPADTIVKSGPVVFDNVTLDSIAKDIATYHHLDMDLQNEQASQFRFYFVWNQEDRLQEVIEKLNMFEQINLAVENGKLIVR